MPYSINQNFWDIIFPVVNLLGSTFLYRSYNNKLLKSLFIKTFSIYSKTNYSYFTAINCFLAYPNFIINYSVNNTNFTLKILLSFMFKSFFNINQKKKFHLLNFNK